MLEGFASLVGVISNVMYSYLLIIMLLAVGLYFTLRSRFVQLRLLPESIRVVGEKTDSNSVSAFQALMVSTASRVGTGHDPNVGFRPPGRGTEHFPISGTGGCDVQFGIFI